MTDEYIKMLQRKAGRSTLLDYDEPSDITEQFGDSVDDAYYSGVRDGETALAREMLLQLNLTWDTSTL